ncbi:hypothetical protein PQR05_16025 [Paraburkholderia sediminicola]|uniref:hypothetical protein n=1 Tax=Paraburkholderia sediminicola TaxID=458836 RepID=UPI0038B8900D
MAEAALTFFVAERLYDGSLAQFSDIEVAGPFGYWLDVAQRHAALGRTIPADIANMWMNFAMPYPDGQN